MEPSAEECKPSVAEQCHLLELPPELRNMIYDFAYPLTDSGSKPSIINLFTVDPPSPALPLISKQIHHEINNRANRSYMDFWRNNHFTVDLEDWQNVFFWRRGRDNSPLGKVPRRVWRLLPYVCFLWNSDQGKILGLIRQEPGEDFWRLKIAKQKSDTQGWKTIRREQILPSSRGCLSLVLVKDLLDQVYDIWRDMRI